MDVDVGIDPQATATAAAQAAADAVAGAFSYSGWWGSGDDPEYKAVITESSSGKVHEQIPNGEGRRGRESILGIGLGRATEDAYSVLSGTAASDKKTSSSSHTSSLWIFGGSEDDSKQIHAKEAEANEKRLKAEEDALAEFERVKTANAEAEIVAKMKADKEKQAESEATTLAEADALAEFERVKTANAEAEIVAKMKADKEKQAESEATTLAEADALAEFERVKTANAEAEIVAKMKADKEKQAECESASLIAGVSSNHVDGVAADFGVTDGSFTSKIVLSNEELAMNGAPEGDLFVAEVVMREDLVLFGHNEDPSTILQFAIACLSNEVRRSELYLLFLHACSQ